MGSSSTSQWSADPREALRVREGFDLSKFDTRAKPGWEGSKSAGRKLMAQRGELLSELQERLYADGRAGGDRALLCIVQGLDTAGKGGVARHVMGMVDPQGVALRAFGVPTKEEADHHYLWRVRKALPDPGRIGVFDRSHYEDVLVVRVDNLVDESEWSKRYEEINEFESKIVESGTTVLKFALMVSHDEQGERLMSRLDRPDKRWKYSSSDLKTRHQWDAFQSAYQAVFDKTSTEHAPWHVIPADRKWYSRLAITEIITRTMIDMDLKWPEPKFDPIEQRAKLAATMSDEALADSVDDTEDDVTKAINDSIDVRSDAADIRLGSGSLREAKAEAIAARLAVWRAELNKTAAHKRELLAERQWSAAKKNVKREKKAKLTRAHNEAEDT